MTGYRDKWFNANQSWNGRYQCKCCGKWFLKKDIDIDHIIPRNRGGTDELWNLQSMCKHCNRQKQDDVQGTVPDLAQSVITNIANGRQIDNIGQTIGSVLATTAVHSLSEALGVKKKRNYSNSSYRSGGAQKKTRK